MANRIRRLPTVRGTKRGTFWISLALDGTQTAAGNAITLHTLLTNAQMFSAELIDQTIIRTRGVLSVRTDQLAQSEGGILAVGIKLQNERARATGVNAVSAPFTLPDQGWFVYEMLTWNSIFGTAVGLHKGYERVVDSKAMRKVTGSDSLVLVTENLSTSFACVYTFGFHMLVKHA